MLSPAPDGSPLPRSEETRVRNDRIALSARTHHFDDVALVPFLCECSDDRCNELLRMPLDVYRVARQGGDFLTAPGHQVDGAAIVRIKDCCWLHRSSSPN